MRASKPAFCAFVKNSKPQGSYYDDSIRRVPFDNKPHPPVPQINFKFIELDENTENIQPQCPKNPRAKHIMRNARQTNPRFRRASPATHRPTAQLNPVVADAPISPAEARAKYAALLTPYEMDEINQYPEIYYVGHRAKKIRSNTSGMHNYGFDDSQHHYRGNIGDHIAYRYEIRAVLGKGAFGQVIRAFDHKTKTNVALKLIINTQQMHEQGKIEVSLLKKLNEAPDFEQAHIIHCLDSFVFRRHICATFEILGLNLYEYSRSMRFRPLASSQMRSIAHDMLKALAFMHANNIIHCDMKPENVLMIPNSTNDVKVIDFGSSCIVGNQIYEYIQSRFYRAPEVILGASYGPPMDIWSFACIVAEMMTGHPLFPGEDENEQMQMYMEVLGAPPRALIEKCPRSKYFFTPDFKPVMSTINRRRRKVGGSTLRLMTHISDNLLIDLLSKCLEWDQRKRITAADALKHPWFSVREVQTARSYRGPSKMPRWR